MSRATSHLVPEVLGFGMRLWRLPASATCLLWPGPGEVLFIGREPDWAPTRIGPFDRPDAAQRAVDKMASDAIHEAIA